MTNRASTLTPDTRHLSPFLHKEDGYALPSVLFLVTILTLVAFSVLLMDYLERQIALRSVAQVKAEYAAQSGVIRALITDSSHSPFLEPFAREHISFEDGTEALVRMSPWGVYCMVESLGRCSRLSRVRFACVASKPPDAFKQALVLGNSQHQLVFAGTSRICGDISIGAAGATTGSLYGYSTPAILPLLGRVMSGAAGGQMPQVDREATRALRQYYENLLTHRVPAGAVVAALAPGEAIGTISDSIDILFASGPMNFRKDSLFCRSRPLLVVAASRGCLSITEGMHIVGPLTIICEDSIHVGPATSLDHVVLYSQRAICVVGTRLSSVQLLAPKISLDSATVCSYPSTLVSIALTRTVALQRQNILLKGGSRLEGFIFLDSPFGDDVVTVEPNAHVTGAIYSTSRVTLDGTVEGSVLAGDVYFYEAPTTYLGWLRSGVIDRSGLPEGFLVPAVFVGTEAFGILEWL